MTRIGWVLLSFPLALQAHDVITTKITFSREVSRIVYKHCGSCHHEGAAAFSLMTYQEARPWAEAIKEQVLSRRMPPWNAVKGFGEFQNERALTQEDIEVLADWVVGGAPEGNPEYLPTAPVFPPEPKAKGRGSQLAISGSLVAKSATAAIGIRPTRVPPAGAMQVVACLPTGEIEPLIWIEQFHPGFDGAYYFRERLRFPAGTRFEITPREGAVALLTSTP